MLQKVSFKKFFIGKNKKYLQSIYKVIPLAPIKVF